MAKEERPEHFLKVAKKHLDRVQNSWDPPDWSILGTYGLYCLEALVRAAALKAGETPVRTHWGKADQAENLAKRQGLPNISVLLRDLNALRKSEAYGDSEVDESDYDAEDLTEEIQNYFDAVTAYCKTN